LLGAVAYCIKTSTFDQGIVLDLAGGIDNDRALKSYERFGFVHSEHLRTSNCYPTDPHIKPNNLIMFLDLEGVSLDDIVEKVNSASVLGKRNSNRNERNEAKEPRVGGKRKTKKTKKMRRRTKRKIEYNK
jgi:hypothetical protein